VPQTELFKCKVCKKVILCSVVEGLFSDNTSN